MQEGGGMQGTVKSTHEEGLEVELILVVHQQILDSGVGTTHLQRAIGPHSILDQ